MRVQENNKVTVVGVVAEKLTFDHMTFSEAFYRTKVAVLRQSGYVDEIPCMISERLVDVTGDLTGTAIKVSGQFRSFNQSEGDRRKLVLFVFAQDVEFPEEQEECTANNSVFLDGYLCKAPTHRKTPLGREVSDLLVAVNRPYGKTDYIPAIVWGRSAALAGKQEVGARVLVWGRVQSRTYNKLVDKDTYDTRTAYEISVSKFEVGEARNE